MIKSTMVSLTELKKRQIAFDLFSFLDSTMIDMSGTQIQSYGGQLEKTITSQTFSIEILDEL